MQFPNATHSIDPAYTLYAGAFCIAAFCSAWFVFTFPMVYYVCEKRVIKELNDDLENDVTEVVLNKESYFDGCV